MSPRNALFRLAGYDPASLGNHSRDDHQPIIHMGWVVAIAAVIAGMNWLIGGYVFAGGGSARAVGAALMGALIGTSIIVIIDRSMLYSIDTHSGRRLTLLPLVAFRIMLTCFVSSITTQAVAPVLLKSELELQALKMREASDRSRNRELETRYDSAGLQQAAATAEANLRNAERAVQIVPPDIQARLGAARTCWQGYARRRFQLVREGLNEAQARHRIAAMASRCALTEAAAQRELQEYGERSRASLAVAQDKYRDALRIAKDTGTILVAKEEQAARIEQHAITPLSATVLNALIATDAGARSKFWSVFGLIMGLELLPLLSKLVAPQTVAGIRVATDRVIAIAHHLRRRKESVEQNEVEEALRSSMASAMRDAAASPELRRFAIQLFAAKAAALVPMEVFKAMMNEIEAREQDLQSFNRRHPSHGRKLADAYAKTVDETLELLRRIRPEPAAWRPTHDAA